MANDQSKKLMVDVVARINKLEKEMNRATGVTSRNMKAMEDRAKQMTGRMDSLMSSAASKITSYGKAFAGGLLGGIAAGGITGIAASIQDMTKSFADLGREAQTAGLNVEDFQKWRYAADQNRIGIDAMIDGFKELSLRADEYIASAGKSGSAAEAFRRIGMSPEEVKTRLKDPSDLMLEIIDRTRRMKDTAAGVRIFDELLGGQGGEQFVRLIEQGRDGITNTLNEAEKMGAVFDADFIAKADEIDRAFNRLATTMGVTIKGAIVDAATALQGFLSSWTSMENKTLSGVNAELDTLTKRKAQLEAQRGTTEDAVLGWIGKDAATESKAVDDRIAALLARKDELESIKLKPVTIETAPTPIAAPSSGSKGKSHAEKARDKAAKAAERERQAVKDLIADLQFEASLVGKSAVEKEKMIALRHAGSAATAQEKAQIEALVESTYKQNEAWENTQSRIQEVNDAGREFAATLVSGLMNGESAADALSDAFGRLADRILDDVLDSIFELKDAAGGNWLTNLFGLGGSGGGGFVGGAVLRNSNITGAKS